MAFKNAFRCSAEAGRCTNGADESGNLRGSSRLVTREKRRIVEVGVGCDQVASPEWPGGFRSPAHVVYHDLLQCEGNVNRCARTKPNRANWTDVSSPESQRTRHHPRLPFPLLGTVAPEAAGSSQRCPHYQTGASWSGAASDVGC